MMMFSFNNVSFVFGSAFDKTTIVIFIHIISQGGISWISHFININTSLYISISIEECTWYFVHLPEEDFANLKNQAEIP